ncbi:MAG: hypothetical protein KGJ09_06030 [Candidatus Omnitrophica bacterium]|nr:hypothetical protein [Candidatus Omnitrophota bacterium]MDE2009619.1 hypothetical protein [Candidatus Omnitrophota bacterium]MDE2214453.1 hypothetical protein [Candidatus Omnitrophota bacterium]MDE2231593.1 hypothetical protein [Candidatus Omnitrophota bacterium]
MIRLSMVFFAFFLMMSSCSLASGINDAKLKQKYGSQLTHAPFFLRYAFLKTYGEDWADSSYSQREPFLMDYEKNLGVEMAREKAEDRAEAQEEKQRQDERKDELRKERDRIKAQLDEEKAEEKADEERQKSFQNLVKDQERSLHSLERQVVH